MYNNPYKGTERLHSQVVGLLPLAIRPQHRTSDRERVEHHAAPAGECALGLCGPRGALLGLHPPRGRRQLDRVGQMASTSDPTVGTQFDDRRPFAR